MRKFNSVRHYPTILLIFYSIQSPVQEAELNRPLQNQHKSRSADGVSALNGSTTIRATSSSSSPSSFAFRDSGCEGLTLV
jgi:hypothetical protein